MASLERTARPRRPSVVYAYCLTSVRLPGHKRAHLIASIGGSIEFWGPEYEVAETAPLHPDAVGYDRYLAWRSETTACGKAGAWDSDGVPLEAQQCRACWKAERPWEDAPDDAKALVAQTAALRAQDFING